MSFEPDKTEHEKEVEELLNQIIACLNVLIRHNEEITDEIFNEEDIDK